MNPNRYEIFMKAAETKSFTKTAEYFAYTQSAISQAIKSMEAEYRVILFNRTPQGLVLSNEGEFLYESIKEVVSSQRKLNDKVSALHQEQTGTIRLGAYISVTCYWLPKCIQQFNLQFPNICFKLYQEDDNHLLDALRKGVVDALIICDPHMREFSYEPLFEDPFIVVLPKEHPMSNVDSLSLKELEHESFIFSEEGYMPYIQKMFQAAKIKPAHHFDMIDDHAVLAMIEYNHGIGIMPEFVTTRTPYLVSKVKPVESVSREIGFVTRHNDYQTWAIRKFIQFAKNCVPMINK